MKNNRIQIRSSDGVMLEGSISTLERHFIEVSIIHPFVNWKNCLIISGVGKTNPNNFLFRYKEVGEQLLEESYQTLKDLDNSIVRYARIYKDYSQEKQTLYSIQNIEVRDRIERKLENWFFNNFKYISISQREGLIKIIKEYIDYKVKLYIKKEKQQNMHFLNIAE